MIFSMSVTPQGGTFCATTMKIEEAIKKRDEKIDKIIDRFDMTRTCSLSREEIHKRVVKAMVCLNMSYVLADVTNSMRIDAEACLMPFGVAFSRQDKRSFNKMMEHVTAAKKWAERAAFEPYMTEDANLFANDSDWWYNFIRLVEDRTGNDALKTKQLLNWVLTMPSEMGIFKIKKSDFKQYNIDLKNGE